MTGKALAVQRASATAVVARPAPAALDFGALWQMAETLVPTGFLPDHIKTPGQACAIILAGQELGMPPMRALRSIVLVKGKVSEYADSQLARFKSDGGRAWFGTLTDTEAVLHLRHPNGDEHTETFTLEDAKRAGLLTNNQWRSYPKAMLRSRAITAGLKSVGWEGGAGVYDPSEAATFAPRGVHAYPADQPQPSADDTDDAPIDVLLARPLFGNPAKSQWAGKPLGSVPTDVLEKARAYAEQKGYATEFMAIDRVLGFRPAEVTLDDETGA